MTQSELIYNFCLSHSRKAAQEHFKVSQSWISVALRTHAKRMGLPVIRDARCKLTKEVTK